MVSVGKAMGGWSPGRAGAAVLGTWQGQSVPACSVVLLSRAAAGTSSVPHVPPTEKTSCLKDSLNHCEQTLEGAFESERQ